MKSTCFERAIFISWYCSKRDCAFCYLSSRDNEQSPKKDRRSIASILAEAIICRSCGWKVEFLSGGCDTYSDEELLFILKNIYEITKQKQWLNVGILEKKQMELFKPYIEGICGTVECITPGLRDKLCPSKPLKEIETMFKAAEKLKVKKAMTIIIGLGETKKDIPLLIDFIKKNKINRVTFYRLKPQKGTIFEGKKGPETGYYIEWVKKTREAFPDIEIITGSWLTHLDEIHLLLEAGADAITKFPSIRKFNTKYAKQIEDEVKKAGYKFKGTLTKLPKIDVEKETKDLEIDNKAKEGIKKKVTEYLNQMDRN